MADPETYALTIADILAGYPEAVVRRVTAPRTGIVGRVKWIPAPAEVRDACEAEMVPIRREAERNRRLTDNGRLLGPPLPEERPTLDELNAKLVARGLEPVCQRGKPGPLNVTEEYTANVIKRLTEQASTPVSASPELKAKLAEVQE